MNWEKNPRQAERMANRQRKLNKRIRDNQDSDRFSASDRSLIRQNLVFDNVNVTPTEPTVVEEDYAYE